mgnify:CR=1 FL=1
MYKIDSPHAEEFINHDEIMLHWIMQKPTKTIVS